MSDFVQDAHVQQQFKSAVLKTRSADPSSEGTHVYHLTLQPTEIMIIQAPMQMVGLICHLL